MEYYIILDLQSHIDDGFDHILAQDVGCINFYYGKEFAEDEMLRLQQIRKGSKLFLFKAISRTNPTGVFGYKKTIFRIDQL